MRNVSDMEDFPFLNSANCYFEIQNDGQVIHIPHKNRSDFRFIQESYMRVKNNNSKLYVVLPGKWSADLFIVDDMTVFANAFGIEPDEGFNIPSFRWKISEYDKREGRLVWVEVIFACGFRLTQSNIRAFAEFASKNIGWDVSVSKGISGGENMITNEIHHVISVKRNTLSTPEGEYIPS